MGAGGSTIAITWYLTQPQRGADRPSRVVVSNRSPARLDSLRRIHETFGFGVPVEYVLAPTPEDNDRVMAGLRPGSLVINATGLGKDAPGSPITDAGVFPDGGLAWELNYRGDLVFLRQARAAAARQKLTVEDGWVYFLHGWTRVIADVFDVDIPTSGPRALRCGCFGARLAGRPRSLSSAANRVDAAMPPNERDRRMHTESLSSATIPACMCSSGCKACCRCFRKSERKVAEVVLADPDARGERDGRLAGAGRPASASRR